MNKGTIIKYTSIICGVLVCITLVSNHPVPIILLGVCAGGYFIGKSIEKGKINI